uniref:Uncharacterized protein n=1 Tax=Setaria digitata TaxID=48799 RepID=A0A915PMI2_9BILA
MAQANILLYASFLLICSQQISVSDVNHFGVTHGSNNMDGNGHLSLRNQILGSNPLNQIFRPRSRNYGIQNDFETIYQNVQMFQPISQIDYNSESTNSSEKANVMLQIQLMDYVNQGLQLPKGQTCVCPSGFSCSYLGTFVPRCFMSFTVILLSPDESVKYFSTEFMPLTPFGKIDTDNMSAQQKQAWQQPHTFYLTSKPSAIDVFVHHMGAVINAHTGELTQMQTVVHVDTFILSLSSVIPSIGNDHLSVQSRNLDGAILQTQQVEKCLPCPWGITQELYCQNSSGAVLVASAEDMVSSTFKAVTIVLGVLVGILLIILTLMTVYFVLISRRTQRNALRHNNTTSGHNYSSTLRSEGNANRPLLQSINSESHSKQGVRAPIAAPRSIPQLDVLPTKSSLRKGTTPLSAAHLGGASSLNDTLNSTLSSVPLPPSKEADV